MTEIHIVGTAHVSQKSIEEVRETVDAVNPDVIAIELDAGRFATLKQQMREDETGIDEKQSKTPDVKGILNGNFTLMLVQWLLGYVQRKIGMNVGVDPGSEMKEAIRLAEERNIRIVLIDRDINTTIARFWKAMKFGEKVRLIWALVSSVFGKDDETDAIDAETVDSLTHGDVMESSLAEFHNFSPSGANALIDERDAYLAHGVINLEHSSYERAVVVCGAGHVPGITHFREHPEMLPPKKELDEKPKKYPWGKIIGIVFIALFVVVILAIGFSGATDKLIWAIFFWVLINGILAGIGTAVVRGHPFSVATASALAWMTSLNPFLACGWFAAIVEAKMRPPHGGDFKAIGKSDSIKTLFSIPLFRIIAVAAGANLGSILGTVCFFLFLSPVLGVSVDQMKDLLILGFQNMWNLIIGSFIN